MRKSACTSTCKFSVILVQFWPKLKCAEKFQHNSLTCFIKSIQCFSNFMWTHSCGRTIRCIFGNCHCKCAKHFRSWWHRRSTQFLIRVVTQGLKDLLRLHSLINNSLSFVEHEGPLPLSRLLQNPFGQRRGASQGSEADRHGGNNGATRGQKFQRSGRSHSAPGSYNLLMDRLLALVSSWFKIVS